MHLAARMSGLVAEPEPPTDSKQIQWTTCTVIHSLEVGRAKILQGGK
jgi:hypothetical protein